MSKTATKAAETVEFATFEANQASDQFRAFAEKGIEQSKEAYEKLKAGADDVQKALESSFEQSRTAATEIGRKSIAAMRTNTEAGFAHLEALMSVKSLSELMELQTSFLRKRIEALVEQGKEFQSVSTKAAEEVAKPIKGVVEKAMKELKVA